MIVGWPNGQQVGSPEAGQELMELLLACGKEGRWPEIFPQVWSGDVAARKALLISTTPLGSDSLPRNARTQEER